MMQGVTLNALYLPEKRLSVTGPMGTETRVHSTGRRGKHERTS
jgi:hypothetical protein